MRPFFYTLAIIYCIVHASIAGTNFPCKVNLWADTLSYNISMPLQHGNFCRTFKMTAISICVNTSCKDTAIKMLLSGFNECLTYFRTKCVTHDEKIPAIQHNVLAHGHIKVIIRNEKIPYVQKSIDSTYTALRNDIFHSCLTEYPKHLTGRVCTRNTASPAMHFDC